MRLTINVNHVHTYPEIEDMTLALENLTREIGEAKAGQASAVVLINAIREQLTELASNATELQSLKSSIEELAQELSDSTDDLAAAVGTPGEGEDPVAPEEDEDEEEDPNA